MGMGAVAGVGLMVVDRDVAGGRVDIMRMLVMHHCGHGHTMVTDTTTDITTTTTTATATIAARECACNSIGQ